MCVLATNNVVKSTNPSYLVVLVRLGAAALLATARGARLRAPGRRAERRLERQLGGVRQRVQEVVVVESRNVAVQVAAHMKTKHWTQGYHISG